MNQNQLQKTTKSKLWIIGTIWANVAIVSIIVWIVLRFLSSPIMVILGEIVGAGLIWLINVAALVFAIRLGIKTVLKKTSISPQDAIKISLGVIALPLFFQFASAIYTYFHFIQVLPSLGQIFKFLVTDGLLFSATYFWLKKSV